MNATRKNRFVLLMLTVVGSAFLMACSSGAKPTPLTSNALILAFGDSLTFGTGAAPTESYPAVLEHLVGRRVVNSGVPGEVSAEGLSRLPGVLEREKPALLILCHGGNDLLRHLDRRQAASNIRAMIRLARERGAAVVLIAVPSPGLALSPAPFYREIAAEMKVPVEEEALTGILSDGSLRSDYIHPNAAGYRRLAASLAALLREKGMVE